MRNKKITILASILLSTTIANAFDFGSITKSVMEKVSNTTALTNNSSASTLSSLSESTVTSGLKEALKVGVNYATSTLGKENGFLNSEVKIPLPENLQKVESVVRKFGGEKIADDLINSMNSAATKAAPKTAEIFINAIEKMSLDDAKKILAGDDNAATEYFKTNTSDSLKNMIKPIVQETMKENKVASYYDSFNTYYKQYGKSVVENSQVMNLAKSFGADSFIPTTSDENLDDYVTNKALNGLFEIIAKKESSIRSNPVEQTTSLLKKVFGN